MSTRSLTTSKTYRLTAYGLMTALAFVANYIRFPFLGSQIAISNALCVLCGFILGPWAGFVTAGLGNFLYDLIAGYGLEGLITLVSKGAIALVAGLISFKAIRKSKLEQKDYVLLVVGALAGAVTYVALYMLKTYVMGITVKGLTSDGAVASLLSKLPASSINAAFATIAAPILMSALHQPLHKLGVIGK
ncbi:MAG: ECF transporter S component [Clostridia bacterium]|nr:ECF transporter S component [Clostridia bacterium]